MCKICDHNSDFFFDELLGNRKKFHKTLCDNVGAYLGQGSEGYVYEYGRGRVIKICRTQRLRSSWEKVSAKLKLIHSMRPRYVARLYGYGRLSKGYHYVVMEKLGRLTLEESIACNEVMYHKGVSTNENANLFKAQANKLEKRYGLRHTDPSSNNIMRASSGWKFVDLESFTW